MAPTCTVPAFVALLVLSAGPPADPPDAAPPLAGPAVAETRPARTLVVRTFDGSVRRPEVPAEIAAAELLPLDGHARAAIAAIMHARAAILDEFVADNTELLGKVETAASAGRTLDLILLGHEALIKLAPLREHGTLRDRVRAALPPELAPEYDRILREYSRAIIDEGRRTPDKNGRPRGAPAILAEERLASFGREIELAYARVLKSGELVYRLLMRGIELRPEQSARIRQLVGDFMERHGEGAAEKDWAMLGLSIVAHLDQEQTIRFARNVKRLSE